MVDSLIAEMKLLVALVVMGVAVGLVAVIVVWNADKSDNEIGGVASATGRLLERSRWSAQTTTTSTCLVSAGMATGL